MSTEQRPRQASENHAESQQIHLLFEKKPEFDPATLLEAIRRYVGKVESGQEQQEGFMAFFFPEIHQEFKDGNLPAQAQLIIPENHQVDLGRFQTAREQGAHWPEGYAKVQASRYEYFLSDFMMQTFPAATRLGVMGGLLRSAIAVLQPDVLYFSQSDQLVDPRSFLRRHSKEDQLFGFVNVRLFRIAEDPQNGLMMDTLGMHALGLPDLELYFHQYAANDVAARLMDYAYYQFEEGPVIRDGDEMIGMDDSEIWYGKRLTSSVGPEREVVRIQTKEQQ